MQQVMAITVVSDVQSHKLYRQLMEHADPMFEKKFKAKASSILWQGRPWQLHIRLLCKRSGCLW